MKNIIFIETHKKFNALRLAMCLAHALHNEGSEVVLAGRKGKMPFQTGMHICEFGLTTKPATLAAAFAKEKAARVISVGSLAACEAALQAKLPYIYVEPENFKEEKPYKNKKSLLSKAQKVVVIGAANKPLDKKHYGKNAVRVQNPAIAVEHGSYAKPACFKKPNNVLAVGALTKEGGIDTLLKVWAQLAPLHDTWHLTVWGEGIQKTALKKFISTHKLQDSTEIVDSATDLRALLSRADIYVHPATSAQGIEELLDAMASRLPVIANGHTAVRSYIKHGVNGCLVPSAEVKTWFQLLDKLMVDWGKRVGLALEAEKTKMRFSQDIFIAAFDEQK